MKALVAEQVHNRLMLERASQKILHRRHNAAVNQWEAYLQAVRRARRVRAKAMAQWLNRHMGRAFHTWAAEVAAAQRRRRLLAKARARWVLRALSAAFQGLVELLAERQPDGQALLQTAQRRLAADWREICYAEL